MVQDHGRCDGRVRSEYRRPGRELNQDHIDRARTIFGAKTEKQAVNRALEMVVIDDEIVEAHEAVGRKGRLIEEVFE